MTIRVSLLPHGLQGDAQRPAIVGTVIRTLPHAPDRQAGQTYSFVAVNQSIPPAVYQLPENVISHFADRVHRLLHAVRHGIRGSWNDLEESDRQALAQLDWRIPDDCVALVSGAERTRPCITNGSGEDFLFFHRQMVVQYKQLMAEAKAPLVEWRELPQPGAGGPNGPSNSAPQRGRFLRPPISSAGWLHSKPMSSSGAGRGGGNSNSNRCPISQP